MHSRTNHFDIMYDFYRDQVGEGKLHFLLFRWSDWRCYNQGPSKPNFRVHAESMGFILSMIWSGYNTSCNMCVQNDASRGVLSCARMQYLECARLRCKIFIWIVRSDTHNVWLEVCMTSSVSKFLTYYDQRAIEHLSLCVCDLYIQQQLGTKMVCKILKKVWRRWLGLLAQHLNSEFTRMPIVKSSSDYHRFKYASTAFHAWSTNNG